MRGLSSPSRISLFIDRLVDSHPMYNYLFMITSTSYLVLAPPGQNNNSLT